MDIVTGVGVLDKAVHVVRAVAARPVSLGDLQLATGLPRATAHRLAAALVEHGLLRRDDAGRFDLGPELATLGRAAAERFPLAGLALGELEALRERTSESVQLFVREGSQRRCVVSLQSSYGLRWIVPEGVLFPLDVGSAGRVLRGETSEVGWIESVEEREPGVCSVSAPVFDVVGRLDAAVSISGPVDRLTRGPGAQFGDVVAQTAARITSRRVAGVDGR